MRKVKNGRKLFITLTLSLAMLVTEVPMTAFAVSTETVNANEKEVADEQTQTEVIREEDAPGAQTEEISEEETTEKDSEDEESGEGEAAKKDSEEEESGEGEAAGKDSEEEESGEGEAAGKDSEEEESGEEEAEEQDESEEASEEMLMSPSFDFVIEDAVLTAYAGTDTDVVIPEGTVEIKANAFENNKTIKTVTFPSSVKTIGTRAFYGCSSLASVDLNEGLETIGEKAFYGVALGEKLSTGAVELGELKIPSTVQIIGGEAFYNCAYLGTVIFEDGNTTELTLKGILGTIRSCPELTKITLPSRLTNIPSSAFRENKKLNEVILGENTETIGSYAFADCSSLKSINFPSSVRTIEYRAFSGCSSLVSADLKEGLVTIGEEAFYGVAFGEVLGTGKVELGTLIIPSTVQRIGYKAFSNCAYLGTVIFEDGDTAVLTIDSIYGTISSCPELTKIILPTRLTNIPSRAFGENTKLKEVILGEKIETIGERAFWRCSSLKSINFPTSVRTIGAEAFSGCSSLGPVDLKEGLVTIGAEAFSGAALGEALSTGKVELGTLVIPSTVQSIGRGAFYNCAYLGKVTSANGDTVVLAVEQAIYHGTFGLCPELTMVILPERITKLEYRTFYDNSKLQTLYIPEGVTEIVDNAIEACPKLTIYGVPGSMAETYANQNNIPFKSKDGLNTDSEVQSVTLTPSFIEETGEDSIGKQIQLSAKVLPDTARNKEVVYESANEAVASVNKDGLVTINGYGETTITVTTVDGGKSAKCEVVIVKEAIDERPDIANATVLFPKNKTAYSATYTGEQIRPVMTVSYQYQDNNGKTKTQRLKINVDYTVFYRSNVNAGENTAKVTVRGIGEYKGAITKEFTITPKDIKGVALSSVGDIVYGEEPSVVVTDGTHELIKGEDYEVTLSTQGSASEDTPSVLKVKGIGNYTGISKKSVKFNILKTETDIHSIASEVSVAFRKLPAKGYTYNGKAQKPAVVVTNNSTGKRVAASNYKVIYTNNINAGTANVRVVGVTKKGKGYYGISAPLTFEIKPKDLNKVKVSTNGLIPKTGTIEDIHKSVEDALTVKDGKHVLSEDEYTVDYGEITNPNDIKIGTKYPITLTAKAGGNYSKDSQKIVYIKFGQLNLASKTANVSVRITDAGKNEIALKYNGILLEKGKDYTAVVTKDKKKDTYTVKIKAVKNSAYKGSRTVKNLQAN